MIKVPFTIEARSEDNGKDFTAESTGISQEEAKTLRYLGRGAVYKRNKIRCKWQGFHG
jgi:hypothetical protein